MELRNTINDVTEIWTPYKNAYRENIVYTFDSTPENEGRQLIYCLLLKEWVGQQIKIDTTVGEEL